jgi:hypothetical protein
LLAPRNDSEETLISPRHAAKYLAATILLGAAIGRTSMRVLLGLVLAVSFIFMMSIPSARAQEWCGFLDREHSQVRCGYSSLAQCKQALADKSAVCIPDPSFASTRRPFGGRRAG